MRLSIAEVEARFPTAPTMLDVQHPELADAEIAFDYTMGALIVGRLKESRWAGQMLRWHHDVEIWVRFSIYVPTLREFADRKATERQFPRYPRPASDEGIEARVWQREYLCRWVPYSDD